MMQSKAELLLHLADNALLLGHRNSEWTGHGPILEQDIAISNIALDLIGQARNFYQYAAEVLNESDTSLKHTEDSLAYFRDAPDFRNVQIVELPKGDWSFTVLRQFLFSSWQKLLFQVLQDNSDHRIAAIAEKSLKETTYHLRWSGEWVIRLGDGTTESRRRLIQSLEQLSPYTNELFEQRALQFSDIKDSQVKVPWLAMIRQAFTEATIADQFEKVSMKPMSVTGSGFDGEHTTYLDELLKEMQVLQRAYPGCEW